MRLICPNCDAQYEVSDNAIPVAGRDVQCSNCGHAWFQLPPEVEAEQAAESALFDAPEVEDAAPEPAAVPDRTIIAPIPAPPPLPPVPEAQPPVPQAEEPAAETPVAESPVADKPAAANPAQRQIDESVLTVLREEAEREMIARRLDAQALETQEELGIDSAVAAMVQQDATSRHLAKLKGEDPDARPAPPAPVAPPVITAPPSFADDPEPEYEAPRELTRRDRLPNIEEINSTLRPGDVGMDDDGESFEIVQRPAGRSGFRSGFVLMLILAALVIALYVMAPRIAEQIPGAKPALDSYVATVDAARTWLDGATKNLVTMLRGLAGNSDAP
ncbi:MAG: zinc-ribbon domain-containing protein [Paracoccaceae bacterium]